jgi:hypothetical protein
MSATRFRMYAAAGVQFIGCLAAMGLIVTGDGLGAVYVVAVSWLVACIIRPSLLDEMMERERWAQENEATELRS